MKNIVIVEDDISIMKNLKEYLENEGYSTYSAVNLATARKIDMDKVDLIILDWMLPDGQGIDLLRDIKAKYKNLPVIMLTARADITDKVLGLEVGADDYITKPFDPRELMARIRVQTRRGDIVEVKDLIEQSEVRLDLSSRQVFFQNREIRLNRMEFDLLKFLLLHPNIVFSRQELLDQVWGMNSFPTTRTVDQHILNLRNKISSNLIETLRGVGYRLK